MACCIAMTLNSAYSQLSNEKKYDFLKNYKAPDFKQKRFDLTFNLGGGNHSLSSDAVGRIAETSFFSYSQYANSQEYQGNFRAILNSRVYWDKSDDEELLTTTNSLGFTTINRFYFKPNWFVGVYGGVQAGHLHRSETGVGKTNALGFIVSPSLAIGNGRLEPIQYARNAMDIEKQLNRGNRLVQPYTMGELNKIAKQLAVINNVRFYDFRLRRIEQFEAIDATLREIGGINEFDIAYFAHLADAYLYAQNFQRFSGFRNEIGMASLLNNSQLLGETKEVNNNLSGNVYYNLSYNLPQSYAIQHTLFTSLIAGFSVIDATGIEPIVEENAWLSLGYEFGLYPTTRTNLNLGVKAGVNPVESNFGIALYANGSIYLSPQFRLAFEANFSPESDYSEPYNIHIPSLNMRAYDYVIGGNISLRYAIF